MLTSENADKAVRVGQWVSIAAPEIDQFLIRNYVVEYAFHKDEDGNVVRTKIDKALRRFLKMFEMIETAVSNGYFGINSFSMVDCFVAPILTATNMWPEGEEATRNSILIRDYLSQMSERQNFKNTVP